MPETAGQTFIHTPTPGLPEFDYIKPASLTAASQFLAEHAGEARPFMGGTDVFVRMRDGFWTEKYIVNVKGLDGMNDVTFDPTTGLTIGASVNMNRLIASLEVKEHYPLLAEAAHTVASYQLRTRATLVGNICNASPAGDTIGACMVLDGTLHIHGVDGMRKEPLSTFFVGPGQTVLKPGDIATAITFPIPPAGYAAKYIKLGRNAIGDLAIVGVTALGFPDRGAPSGYRVRLALASVAPIPLVPTQAEAILAEKPITEATINEAAQAAMDASTPIDDVRGSARYRKLMVKNLTRRAVTQVWEQIRE
ncbi:MAG: xanthine dehydrogenase family protein subunit M [Anaerolineales bacterium]|nr:MAG: xanthine dehydrogenase family protein subunit M [Anaerolineales bacterium]